MLFRARGTTRETLIEGAKQKHTQREGLYDLRIRCGGVGHTTSSVYTNNLFFSIKKSLPLIVWLDPLNLILGVVAHSVLYLCKVISLRT